MISQPSIIFFDGYCNLCSKAVQFILPRDREGYFNLAPLSGTTAEKHLTTEQRTNGKSLIVLDQGAIYTQSDAAFQIAAQLKNWRWIRMFRILPKGVRDCMYRLIAKNRYRIFGKQATCFVPKSEWTDRFLP